MSTLKSFFWGVGTAALAAVMAPKVKKMTRPMMEKGKDKAETMVEKGKKTLQEYKDSKKNPWKMLQKTMNLFVILHLKRWINNKLKLYGRLRI